ncbi:MAG TPA: hypothetical protein VEK55_05690, partial [Xanthobacteraceae bacterium]|nr:hypothetical protein [Xanthobacteraceae bacterium]
MDGIAAKVAQEIAMLLEHDDINASPRQKEAEHESTRAAAGDTAFGGFACRSHTLVNLDEISAVPLGRALPMG